MEQLFGAAFVFGQFAQNIGLLVSDTFCLYQLLPDLCPWLLIQFIYRTANSFELVRFTIRLLDHHFEYFSVVDLDQKARHSDSFQDLLHDGQHLGIWNHRIIFASNIEIALVELSEPALIYCGLISPVYFPDVESLYFLDIRIVGHEPGEGYSQIVS